MFFMDVFSGEWGHQISFKYVKNVTAVRTGGFLFLGEGEVFKI